MVMIANMNTSHVTAIIIAYAVVGLDAIAFLSSNRTMLLTVLPAKERDRLHSILNRATALQESRE